MTPEGRVKVKIKGILGTYGDIIHAHWPVQRGMGSPTLDCNLTVNGYAMSIEAKAPGEKPTKRQWLTIDAKRAAGEIVLVVDGRNYCELESVLENLVEESAGSYHDGCQRAHQYANENIERFRLV